MDLVILPDGDQTATNSASARDIDGGTTETSITNTTYPLTSVLTTTKTTKHIVNGVVTETVETTYTYPPSYMRPPSVTTATRTMR